jgi:hypothetical protein
LASIAPAILSKEPFVERCYTYIHPNDADHVLCPDVAQVYDRLFRIITTEPGERSVSGYNLKPLAVNQT